MEAASLDFPFSRYATVWLGRLSQLRLLLAEIELRDMIAFYLLRFNARCWHSNHALDFNALYLGLLPRFLFANGNSPS